MKLTKAYIAWILATFFYCYQYMLRVFPANIEQELRGEFHLTAQEFGLMGSCTIYAYAFMQIPAGILIDRIGFKKVLITSNIFCIFGTFLMTYAQDFDTLKISRILIGIGSASAFMSALKIAADYLPNGLRGLLMGATLTFGTMGATLFGAYSAILLSTTNWRNILFTVGWIGVICTLFNFIIIDIKNAEKNKLKTNTIFSYRSLVEIITNRSVIIYAILAIGVYTPLSVLTDLWGPAFLIKKYHVTKQEATMSIMFLFAGLSIGSLFLPAVCEKWNCLSLGIQICSFNLLFLFSFLLLGPCISINLLKFALFLMGVCCGAEMICFSGAIKTISPDASGLAIGIVNTLNMLGGAFFQQIIGYLLDLQWTGEVSNIEVRIYNSNQFIVSFLPLLFTIALCCFLSIKLNRLNRLK